MTYLNIITTNSVYHEICFNHHIIAMFFFLVNFIKVKKRTIEEALQERLPV